MKPNRNSSDLDALLKSAGQESIRKAVQSLPEESLSLAWRSDLNEKLRHARPISRWRTRFAVAWRPALGLALAGCLAMVVAIQSNKVTATPKSANLEASLVAAYDDSANSDELAGSGLAFHEVSDTTQKDDSSSDWSETDVSSL